MPARSPLPDREHAICKRLREARVRAGLPRVVFAQRIGIDSSRLSNYEHSRTPVPYSVASRAMGELDTCQAWLATGEPPVKPFVEVLPAFEELVPPRMLFSEVYDRVLGAEIEERLNSVARMEGVPKADIYPEGFIYVSPIGTHPDEALKRVQVELLQMVPFVHHQLPHGLRGEFVHEIDQVTEKYLARLPKKLKGPAQDQEIRKSAAAEVSAFFRHKLGL